MHTRVMFDESHRHLQFGIDRQWEDVVARNPNPWPTCKRTQRNISAANDTGILHRVDDVLDLDRRQTAPLHPAIDDGLDKQAGVLIGEEQY